MLVVNDFKEVFAIEYEIVPESRGRFARLDADSFPRII